MQQEWIGLYESYFGRKYSEENFWGMFGTSPRVCTLLLEAIKDDFKGSFDVRLGILMVLYFLTNYTTEIVSCHVWNVSRPTWRERIKTMMNLLNQNLEFQYTPKERFNIPIDPRSLFKDVYCVVDVTECLIARSSDDYIQWEFYSGKKKRHTLKYEIIARVTDGQIVWVNGPFPGWMSDIQLLRHGKFEDLLTPGELILGDKAYHGHLNVIVPFKKPKNGERTIQQTLVNAMIGSLRQVIENAIRQIKKFKCLSHPWRHSLDDHPKVFKICSILAQLNILLSPIRPELHNLLI
eukprot:TRINITY_DN5937_c0_g1_i1.p1 TRINITY_DN5937_c0_g1~~TRINITY_DN5937_c0_g1_i1.p1  ORF type:complete len:293 (-),score=20.15 TRINITY_DN5937_c0_g1_i1:93-971(-)